MNFNNIDDLKVNGFSGYKRVRDLQLDRSDIPKTMGVYMVINTTPNNPNFIDPGVGGFFKGKNPNVDFNKLSAHFIRGSQIVYIGKAGGPTSAATLHSRIGQFLRFGEGKNVGHWGGRLIWQLANHQDLLFCWKTTPNSNPREVEKHLISDFKNQFGKLPFANLTN